MLNENYHYKVLVVDDTEANIDILVGLLSDIYDVSVAMDGESALDIAQDILPDIILLDVMMPDMDGYEVCQRLKANSKTQGIPVIFVTALNEIGDEVKGFELGAVDYLTKPIQSAVVLARIKTHLSLKVAREKLEKQNQELMEAAKLREDVERITRHDLKSPINVIIGFPELIAMEGNLSSQQEADLKMIEDSGYRMLNMINLSLDLFKMERGIYQFKPKNINLYKTLNKILRENLNLIQSKELSVDILVNEIANPPENTVFRVNAEELLCFSMFGNLVRNAMEASPQQGQISISCTYNNKAKIEIHNSGVVPEEIREHFFDKYATSGKEMGTGLGTYSARLIAETQKGSIGFNSSIENGTTVWVELEKGES